MCTRSDTWKWHLHCTYACICAISLTCSQHVVDDDKIVADVVQRLKIIARMIEEKSTQGEPSLRLGEPSSLLSTQGEPSSHLTQIYSLLSQDLHLSWEGVAELFMAMFNALRSLAKQNPETIPDKIQETVNEVIDAVNDWVFQNGGWVSGVE